MNKAIKIIIVIVLILAVGIVIAVKQKNNNLKTKPSVTANTNPVSEPNQIYQFQKLPKLIDLGADKCIPCKMMKPVLDELRSEYKGILDVVFIDVWKDPAPGQKYGIRVIPTQIFLDPNDKELYRHEGFLSKEDILAKWKKFGFDLKRKD